jgi:phosphatidylserine/phosphatidylglycerophosphate/cardiolipin synthase-like enzyme
MKRNRAVLTAAATAACILASIAGAPALWRDGSAERERPAIGAAAVHYAPAENLEHIDVGLIDRAKTSIDMAAYVLTDWAVIQALTRAADRGVMIRVYLDGGQFDARDLKQPFLDLRATPGSKSRPSRQAAR